MKRLLWVLGLAVFLWCPSADAQTIAPSGGEEAYTDTGGIYTCSGGSFAGPHCYECGLTWRGNSLEEACIDIDGYGGSGSTDCRIDRYGDCIADPWDSCDVILVTSY